MEKYLTVSALTKYIKYKFDQDPHLQSVLIKGELSNFKHHSSGHLYFALKDENSVINAMMFKTAANQLDFQPKEGDQVIVEARVSVYERRGSYQIYVNKMQLDGVGNLYQKFEQLKRQLTKEGYFEASHKKAIPKYPQKIAIITASTGAAIRDILNTLQSRYPLVEPVKISTLVQGQQAAGDIIEKLKYADTLGVDTIIVGRGGGSIEDLWSFNEEAVVKAIYECQTPIISAVGHETDTTLSDYVADVRAATPTQAAMIATPDQQELYQLLSKSQNYLNRYIMQYIKHARQALTRYQDYYKFKQPTLLYEQHIQKRDDLDRLLHSAMEDIIQKKQQRLELIQQRFRLRYFYDEVKRNQLTVQQTYEQLEKQISRILALKKQSLVQQVTALDTLSPTKTMLRGYSIVKKDDDVVTSSHDLHKGDYIKVTMKDGTVDAIIEKVRCKDDDR
ncbi:exodeoxyribonuclease VII large subunit [Staphylococcus americanisciuri]|uniref:Exodeoxyribonuclease 7 large subunit n=1 Tax=Staphylococcus americanisciuri TaxID=2973940 RepID=A0ABT2EZ60_9STAP|nr:exodeoxyribonuclease VII large subunit [Staphylococcus americanisciuri]MCS4485506.1 exodeoxyribonuclease VII large subunit [Staphylococcus americanisciuri]